ncbi:MAG: hypothetical protein NVV63_13675 [Opitutus sp.]|nr:hypothetical protein [Opitutus sp.]
MNNPLRYARPHVLPIPDGQRTRDQRAPSRAQPELADPYISSGLITLGLLYQFVFHLAGFITRRRAP